MLRLHLLVTVSVVGSICAENTTSSEQDGDILSPLAAVFATNGSSNASRSMVEGTFGDPDGCIFDCWSKETAASEDASQAYADQLAELILLTIANSPNFTRSDSLTLSPILERLSIEKTGPLFEQLCKISQRADYCYSLCVQSQLRNLIMAMHYNTDIFCEPQKNWKNFSECYDAFACVNRTLIKSECDSKCGQDLNARDFARLQVRNSTSRFVLQTDEDLSSQVEPICKSNNCYADCNKLAIVERCGIREYGLYLRLKKYDVQSLLTVAREVQGIDPRIPECQRFL